MNQFSKNYDPHRDCQDIEDKLKAALDDSTARVKANEGHRAADAALVIKLQGQIEMLVAKSDMYSGEVKDLECQLSDAKNQSIISSVPCPLCEYEKEGTGGVPSKFCSMHEIIDGLECQIKEYRKFVAAFDNRPWSSSGVKPDERIVPSDWFDEMLLLSCSLHDARKEDKVTKVRCHLCGYTVVCPACHVEVEVK